MDRTSATLSGYLQTPRMLKRSRASGSRPFLWTLVFTLAGAASCAPPPKQDEFVRIRAEIAALSAEVQALKAYNEEARAEQPVAESAPEEVLPEAPPPPPSWEERFATFNAETRDKSWARRRESPLLRRGVAHIKASGASLNSVRCKATACLIIVDVPAKTRKPYEPMANPWPASEIVTHTQPSYNKGTRWSYLVQRHPKDDPALGAEAIDPFKLTPPSQPAGVTSPAQGAGLGNAPAVGSKASPAAKSPPQSNKAVPSASVLPTKPVAPVPAQSAGPAKAVSSKKLATTAPAKKAAPTQVAPSKKAVAAPSKKAAPAKVAPPKVVPPKKAAPAKVAPPKKAVAAPSKKAAPAQVAPSKKAVAAAPSKKAAPAKVAPPKKAAPPKVVPPKKAAAAPVKKGPGSTGKLTPVSVPAAPKKAPTGK